MHHAACTTALPQEEEPHLMVVQVNQLLAKMLDLRRGLFKCLPDISVAAHGKPQHLEALIFVSNINEGYLGQMRKTAELCLSGLLFSVQYVTLNVQA